MPSEAPYLSRDVQHFEHWSHTYEDSWMQRRLFSRVHEAVLELAATNLPPAVVLDVGCGTGRLLRAAATRWPEAQLIGVDPAQGMVDVARELTSRATIYRGLAESLPLAEASVDLVLSTLSFHHWHDQAAGVLEIVRVLRPGGHFLLADFAPPQVMMRLIPGGALSAPARLRLFSAAELRIEREHTVVYPFILATLAVR